MQAHREGFVHLLYAIILTQFVAIAVLLGGFSNEYLANVYYKAWIDSNYPWIGSLLQGQVDALLVGMALAATVLLIQRMRVDARAQSVAEMRLEGTNDSPVQDVAAMSDALPQLDKIDA
jgi:hypothetical protein